MLTVVLTFLLIVVARIVDVSLGTLRTLMVVQGRRLLAFVLGFFEILIWVTVVSGVIQHLRAQPAYALAYALGFALGTYAGVTLERRLALGRQVVRIISRQGPELAVRLRELGLRVTQFDGYGRDGAVQELFIEVERRETPRVVREARRLDPRCYYMIDDVRATSSATLPYAQSTGWRAVLKKK